MTLNIIINQLKKELTPNLMKKTIEFEELVNAEQFRQAYSVLEELKNTDGWTPSQTLLNYYEKFWWEYAN